MAHYCIINIAISIIIATISGHVSWERKTSMTAATRLTALSQLRTTGISASSPYLHLPHRTFLPRWKALVIFYMYMYCFVDLHLDDLHLDNLHLDLLIIRSTSLSELPFPSFPTLWPQFCPGRGTLRRIRSESKHKVPCYLIAAAAQGQARDEISSKNQGSD